MPFIVSTGARQLRHVILLLPLHPSVLKPDLDLTLCEAQNVRDLDATTASQVSVEMKFFLELQCLEPCVRLACSLRLVHVVYIIHTNTNTSVDALIN